MSSSQMPSFSNGSPLHIDLSHHPHSQSRSSHSNSNNHHKAETEDLESSDVENALIMNNGDSHFSTNEQLSSSSGRR
ncbi:hypothetical protein B9Z55_020332 [Caenorhabditis nigoni]|uniref:Uncharacterized protein n=2 Tax=Caenorhabditis nigoni TaxID=1611254 RepID=A0A2G5TN16_9PELO|nr:hypothetical protein B9Z55_020332 [Caenorhabditis nigoni]